MNSYFDYINPKSIHIIFNNNLQKDQKHIVLDPRSPTLQRQPPPKLSFAPAGEWEKEYPHYLINNMDLIPRGTSNLNSIVKKSSVPILSYT